MKAIYNLVTFLAALVILAWAGWETYLHWDVVTGKAPMVWHGKAHHKKCCCKECKCENCPKDCAGIVVNQIKVKDNNTHLTKSEIKT